MGETVTIFFLVWISIIGAEAIQPKQIIEDLEKRCFENGSKAEYILKKAPLRSFSFHYSSDSMEIEYFVGLDFVCFEAFEGERKENGKEGRNLKKQGNKGKTREFSGNLYGT